MKIALAQISPKKGDINFNIRKHESFISSAVAESVDLIVFPELSLTGYEPNLSKDLASNLTDTRFNTFQEISESKSISIALGIPLKTDEGVAISSMIFEPNKPVYSYSKRYLHPDEDPYFVINHDSNGILDFELKIGLSICFEISIEEHLEQSLANGAQIYLASVAKHQKGVAAAYERLSNIASQHKIPTMMVNCVGEYDGMQCTGNSAVWDMNGKLLGQLDNPSEGLLIFHSSSNDLMKLDLS